MFTLSEDEEGEDVKGVVYHGVRLMPGSEAFELYQAWQQAKSEADKKKNRQALNAHMEELDRKFKQLEGRK